MNHVAAGEITAKADLVQNFCAQADYMCAISMRMGTYAQRNKGTISFALYETDAGGVAKSFIPVWEQSEDAGNIGDNALHTLYFDFIARSAGRHYSLRFFAPETTTGDGLTVWLDDGAERIAGHQSCYIGGKLQGDHGILGTVHHSNPVSDRSIPAALLYSPVTQCNLNCIHCISRETRKSVHRLPLEIKQRIQGWCRRGLVQQIATDYSGDILWADARFGGELDFLIGLGVPFHIDTNGSHLTEAAAARLCDSRIQSLNISLDAARPETYKRIRVGAPPLSHVVENIRTAIRLRDQTARSRFSITISLTLMKSTFDEWCEFISMGKDLGVDLIHARFLEAYTEDLEHESPWLNKDAYNAARARAIDHAHALGITVAMPGPLEDFANSPGHQVCAVAWGSAAILGNGDVAVCCLPRTKIGNLLEQDMETIWNGPRYQAFRLQVNSPNPPLQCAACPIFRKNNNPDSFLQFKTMKAWTIPYASSGRLPL